MKHLKLAALAAGLAGVTLASLPAVAQDTVNVLSHRVHQSVATGESAGTTGGDVTEDWRAQNAEINWITADVGPLHDRLMRELSLGNGNVTLAYFLNRYASPNVFELFEPLNDYMANDPIEEQDGLSQGMIDAMTFEGNVYGIPIRQATNALIYNEAILSDLGIDGPPATFDELLEMAKQVHHVADDGTEVFGFANHSGDSPTFLLNLAMAHGKQVLTPDYVLNADTPEYISTLTTLKDLNENGGLTSTFIGGNLDSIISDMQNGRAVFTLNPFGRVAVLNDANLSRYPGQIKAMAVPPAADGKSPSQTEVWYLVIPKNSPNKDQAWSLIKALTSPDAVVRQALNGNGPTRAAAFSDPRIVERNPAAAAEAEAVAAARIAFPGFENTARAQEILSEEADAMLLGRQTPEEAAANTQRRIGELLPE